MKRIIIFGLVFVLALFLVGCSDGTDTGEQSQTTNGQSDYASYDVVCTAEQKQNDICTKEYRPVCADDGKTYSNGCGACAAQVNAYNQGECGANGEPVVLDHICTPDEKSAEICTLEYNPVCGDDGNTYGNGCGACSSETVKGWTRGTC